MLFNFLISNQCKTYTETCNLNNK